MLFRYVRMSGSLGDGGAELLDDALQPAQVLQRIDHVMCLFLRDLTAGSLPLLEVVRKLHRVPSTSLCELVRFRHGRLLRRCNAQQATVRSATRDCDYTEDSRRV